MEEEQKSKRFIRLLPLVVAGWIMLCMIGFIGGIFALFPGDKMGESGYRMVISLAVICFSIGSLLLPFISFICFSERPIKKRTKKANTRKKKEQKQLILRIFFHIILHIIAFYALLLGLAFIINFKGHWFFIVVGIVIWVGIYLGMRKFYSYCRTHKVTKLDTFIIIMVGSWIFVFALFFGGIYNSYCAIMDHAYLEQPKELTLYEYSIHRGSSRGAKFYYNLSGIDADGKEHQFRIDHSFAQPYIDSSSKFIHVYYLPHTNVVMYLQ